MIEKAIEENKVTNQFDIVAGNVKTIPFMKVELPDVKQCGLEKSLGGMFRMIGEPAALVTSFWKEVFGRR